ncbi:MAG: hypothetical protein ABIJ59_19540 [Pseudomonadota bacterium]
MGGYGSGRWGGKTTTESQHRIDIRWLKKEGCLRPGTLGSLWLSCGDEQTDSIRYRMESNHMILLYRHRPQGGEWEPVEQEVSFGRTPCNYGGYRTWFLCPRCRKRVAVLYGAGKHFFCRHCYGLAYGSQQEGRLDRLMRKARKIRARLGASNDLLEPILFKPKNMHQKTFDRLRREADHANNLSWLIMGQRFGISF